MSLPQQGSASKMSEQRIIPNRFADYFVICGLDLDVGLEPDRFGGEGLNCSPLDRAYKSKPLAYYPENVPWNPFDSHGICMLSLPHGLRFRTQKHDITPKFHSFATTREDGKRCHGFSLIFFEEVRNRNICNAIHTLQSMFITELSNGQSIYGVRGIKENSVSKSLPRHFKVSASGSPTTVNYFDITKDKLYVAKSISLVCQIPFAFAAELFLTNLYKCLPRQPGPGLSIESYVYNILYEVVIPKPGKSIRIYLPPEEPHLPPITTILQRPEIPLELPLLDFPIRLLFSSLGVECVIQLFTCVLLEKQVLLRSTDYQKLMIVGECISSLLFPFTWPHVYAPILPAALHHFLEAPVPFVMGLHADCELTAKIGCEATLCFVDIDKRSIKMPEELPHIPHKTEFMKEIIYILDKFNVARDKVLEPSSGNVNSHSHIKHNYNPMTSSCTLPTGMQVRSHFSTQSCEMDDNAEKPILSWGRTAPTLSIAKRVGAELDVTFDVMPALRKPEALAIQEQYYEDHRLNIILREIFLNRFVHIFLAYEHYVIMPNQTKEDWLFNRESLQNFDKASFLSDQPEQHRPFLSRFLESQMFATLIDSKITALWDTEMDPNLKLFDTRIKLLRKRHENLIRASSYEPCVSTEEPLRTLENRLNSVDLEVAPPSEILANRPAYFRSFPILEKTVLSRECSSRGNSLRRVKHDKKWVTKDIPIGSKPPVIPVQFRNPLSQPSSDISPSLLAQANWTFIEKLLKEIKTKTKRMLLEKMGNEAASLGAICESSVLGIEENTLVASLCDLLEKIWSHGLQNKQGKSALWSHLQQAYIRTENSSEYTTRSIDQNNMAPALAWTMMRKRMEHFSTHARIPDLQGSPGKNKVESKQVSECLQPLPESIEFDIKNVLAMTEIKTHVGYARAWVRLSLEKKLLSRHFRALLSKTAVLRALYKRSAFLRSEEEKEQFLYHLLTLNTVEYFCFTNTYPTTIFPYRTVIYPLKKLNASVSSAIWISVSGTMGETGAIRVPGSFEFVFHHKNLGFLTTIRIGHANNDSASKWILDNVFVRNEVTGHTYKFPCNRWIGKGIDDGSTERLLVGQRLPRRLDNEELLQTPKTPPRARSPSINRTELQPFEIQELLSNAVNAIVKWHFLPNRSRHIGEMTSMLCGEEGLAKRLEQVFLYGFKSSRLFGKSLYVWDYIVKLKEEFDLAQSVAETTSGSVHTVPASSKSNEKDVLQRSFSYIVEEINSSTQTLGKDGKLQLFICICLRDHLLHSMILPMAEGKATLEMYEENSFLRRRGLLSFLIQILQPLDEFQIALENSLTTQGIGAHF